MHGCYAIVIDGYSTSSLYAPALATLGLEIIHIQSHPEKLNLFLQQHQKNFDFYKADFEYQGDYQALLEQIKEVIQHKSVAAVFIGSAPLEGFQLCDRLAKDFAVAGNDPATTMQRVNKYEMNHVLAEAGIPCLRQCLSNKLEDIIAWSKQLSGPVLLKPLFSAASEGIAICHNQEEIVDAFAMHSKITTDISGARNPVEFDGQVLAQELLEGIEYVVCSFSSAGEHCITSIWKSTKRFVCDGVTKVRDYLELISPEAEEFPILCDYIKRALTALGVTHGPCNSDVMVEPQRGPLLLEVNPRFPGGIAQIAYLQAQGDSYVHQAIEWTLFPEKMAKTDHYPFYTNIFGVALMAYKSGYTPDFDLTEIESLPSCIKIELGIKPGDYVEQTQCFDTLVGMVYLASEKKEILLKDLAVIRQWETENLKAKIKG